MQVMTPNYPPVSHIKHYRMTFNEVRPPPPAAPLLVLQS